MTVDVNAPLTNHIADFRNAIVAGIRAVFPVVAVPVVDVHDGEADMDFIDKYTVKSPAVILTILSGSAVTVKSSIHVNLRMGLYVITRGSTAQQRTDRALAICERLIQLLFLSPWGETESYKAPTEVQTTNLFDGEVDESGLALWLLAWEQILQIPYLESFDDLDDFLRMWQEIHNPGEVPEEVETGTALVEQMIELEGPE